MCTCVAAALTFYVAVPGRAATAVPTVELHQRCHSAAGSSRSCQPDCHVLSALLRKHCALRSAAVAQCVNDNSNSGDSNSSTQLQVEHYQRQIGTLCILTSLCMYLAVRYYSSPSTDT
jgi:hypothetical protein